MEHNEKPLTMAQRDLISLLDKRENELDNWIKNLLGEHWALNYLAKGSVRFSVCNADKSEFVFGQNIDVSFSIKTDFEKECFECNVGSTGSFNPLSSNIGDRARFYIDLGRFLSSDLDWLKKFLFGFQKECGYFRRRILRGE